MQVANIWYQNSHQIDGPNQLNSHVSSIHLESLGSDFCCGSAVDMFDSISYESCFFS